MTQAASGPTTHIETVLAPRVVSPPWASRRAWKTSTMPPKTLNSAGPKRIVPSPLPQGWLQEPVTLGILRELSTKQKAVEMPSRSRDWGLAATTFLMPMKPTIQNGMATANRDDAPDGRQEAFHDVHLQRFGQGHLGAQQAERQGQPGDALPGDRPAEQILDLFHVLTSKL